MEVTYLMTVTHFPLSLGWQLAARPPFPPPPKEGILFCWAYVYSIKYEALLWRQGWAWSIRSYMKLQLHRSLISAGSYTDGYYIVFQGKSGQACACLERFKTLDLQKILAVLLSQLLWSPAPINLTSRTVRTRWSWRGDTHVKYLTQILATAVEFLELMLQYELG